MGSVMNSEKLRMVLADLTCCSAQLSPDATPNSKLIFFQRVAEIDSQDKGVGEGTCQAYYTNWYVGLVIA